MWPGPYGNGGSRKYLISSLEQSLKRLNIPYVDLFYHHRPDPATPVEETMQALADIVHQGKALYVGISNYSAQETLIAYEILKKMGVTMLVHQAKYNMFVRWIEKDLLNTLNSLGMGCVAFSTLAEGMLTGKYLEGIPKDSRMARPNSHLRPDWVTPERLNKIGKLQNIAIERGQTLSQMALQWALRDSRITSVIIGASRPNQIKENLKSLQAPSFSQTEISLIEQILDNKEEFRRNL